MTASPARLDTRYAINTPEGIELQLTPAGPVLRFYAWLIDSLIRTAIYIGMLFVLLSLGTGGAGIALILIFIIEWFYPVYFEVFQNGQTPGKRVFGLTVAQENASPVNLAASMIRNLLRFVDFLPFAYGFGLLCLLNNDRFQRIGDIVAGTVVLHRERLQFDEDTNQQLSSVRPPLPLQLPEQQALIRFYLRSPRLNAERAEELAKLSGPLAAEANSATEHLAGIGRWIMGKR